MRAKAYSLKRLIACVAVPTFLLILSACGANDSTGQTPGLLSVDRVSSEDFDHGLLDLELNQLADQSEKNDNLLYVLSHLFWEKEASESAISIDRIETDRFDGYAATLVFDGVQDDAVRGYRYDLKLNKNAQGIWEIADAQKSWRCLPGRGHSHFSSEPCS